MSAAWFGKVEVFLDKIKYGDLAAEITTGYEFHINQVLKTEELKSWRHSTAILASILNDQKFYPLWLYIEYPMPSGMQRADFILVGGSDHCPKGIILEFKQWTAFARWAGPINNKSPRRLLLSNAKDAKSVHHPFLQVRHYARQIALCSQIGKQIEWSYLAVLPEMSEPEIARLLLTKAVPINAKEKVLGKKHYRQTIRNEVEGLLPADVSSEFAQAFNDSAYSPAKDLIDRIVHRGSEIQIAAQSILELPGIDFTIRQKEICQEIIQATRKKKRTLFIIDGGPGSGKTYVALLVLLRSLALHLNTRLAVYGSRLFTVLEECLDSVEDGNSLLLSKMASLAGQKCSETLDLLICDEAQRTQAKDVEKIFRHSSVIAVFYDERQRLNPLDQGTFDFFQAVAHRLSYIPVKLSLTQALRCIGGEAYHQWVERIISGAATTNERIANQPWKDDYHVEIMDSCKFMIGKLRELGRNHKVITVASWTESEGDWSNPTSAKNIRYQDKEITLYWHMYDHDYIEPWMYGRVEDLDRVCSIYGTQGFESDYVGVIWGKDYIFDGQKFVLGNPHNCFDRTYGLVSSKGWCAGALTFLQNRYRIFLTRGRLGTLIYCEDENTRSYLKALTL